MADKQQLAAALSGSIQATPRNPMLGGVADLLGMAYKVPNMPKIGVPGIDLLMANRNKVMDLLGIGDVQKTANTLSYGGAVGTGKGMTYRPKDETIGAAMTLAPMVAPVARMVGKSAVETGRFVAPKAGQLAEQYMVRTGGILPLDVYHGTPHTLPPTPRNPLGEFDASKIGTGEGAQSYGLGIYTAENPAVAEGYQKTLAPKNFAAIVQNGRNDYSVIAKDGSKVADRVMLGQAHKAKDAFDAAQTGNLYKIDLPDEKIAQMIDYDKPMAEQRNLIEKMRKALVGPDSPLSRSQQFQINDYLNDSVRMRNLYPQSVVDLNDPRIVERLRQVGIPGIKYLDEGSRGAEASKQTRNFVTFPGEEQNLKILERNK